jgi:hypothetical protein
VNALARGPLVALLPRGEAIKNFVYTGMLEEIREQMPVRVISVLPSDTIAESMRKRLGEFTPLVDTREHWLVRIQREILDLAHGRWLWSEAAKVRWHLRDVEARESVGELAKRTLKKTVALPFANLPGLELLSRSDRVLSQRLSGRNEWTAYMHAHRPSLVFNASHIHNNISTPAVRAAQWTNIPTAAFLFSWDNLTSQGRMKPTYDSYVVWNAQIKRDLLRLYPRTDPARVFVTGTPQFDFHFRPEFRLSREDFCARIGADPARPIVMYSTGMAAQMPHEPRIVEGVARALAQVRGVPKPQLVVRVYPKDRTGRFDELAAKQLPDVLFPTIDWEPSWLTPTLDDCSMLTSTLAHVACGINVASTVSLELCMFDKPVLNIGYDPPGVDVRPVSYPRYYTFEHYKPVVDSGAVEVVPSEDALLAALQRAFDEPGYRADGRKRLLEQFFGDTLDGRSSHRVADALLAMVNA